MVTGKWDNERKLEDKIIFVSWEAYMKLLKARLSENTDMCLIIS